MKFLIQIPQLIFGGAEKVLVSFANDLVQRGHEVEILEIYEKGLLKPQFDSRVIFHAICSNEYTEKYYASLNDIKKEKKIMSKVHKIVKLLFSKIVGYRKYAERIAARYYLNKTYDVAINYLEIESPTFLLKSIKAQRYIQWYHTDVMNADNPEETDKMISEFEQMDAIICVAESAKRNFVERYPQLSAKTHVIYNFFDIEAIQLAGMVPFSYSADVPIILSVGRMTEPKKYLRFLNVLACLKNDAFIFRWHILGDGYQHDEIVNKISLLGLEDFVVLDGLTDNPYKYMKNCDLFVLPSAWEGFPTVTIEAKILKCPVLATDVSGIREQLVHGKTGWIVENSEEGLYQGIKYLLENSDVRKSLCSNSGMEGIWSNEQKMAKFFEIVSL